MDHLNTQAYQGRHRNQHFQNGTRQPPRWPRNRAALGLIVPRWQHLCFLLGFTTVQGSPMLGVEPGGTQAVAPTGDFDFGFSREASARQTERQAAGPDSQPHGSEARISSFKAILRLPSLPAPLEGAAPGPGSHSCAHGATLPAGCGVLTLPWLCLGLHAGQFDVYERSKA